MLIFLIILCVFKMNIELWIVSIFIKWFTLIDMLILLIISCLFEMSTELGNASSFLKWFILIRTT